MAVRRFCDGVTVFFGSVSQACIVAALWLSVKFSRREFSSNYLQTDCRRNFNSVKYLGDYYYLRDQSARDGEKQ